MKTICLSLVATLALTACGAGTISVRSTPEGALISSHKQTLGVSPYLAQLTPEAQKLPKDASGCYLAPGFTAQWASGAQATSPDPAPLCNGLDADYHVEIRRPADAPGLQKDLEVANQRESMLAKQQQAQAINNVADAIEMNGMMAPGPFGPYPYW